MEEQTPEHATVRELADLRVDVERRFGRVEKMILGSVVANGIVATLLGTGNPSPNEVVALLQGAVL